MVLKTIVTIKKRNDDLYPSVSVIEKNGKKDTKTLAGIKNDILEVYPL
jgi:hypothetical protein